MLLNWRGKRDGNAKLCRAAALIEAGVDQVLADPATRTPDVGGPLGTDAFADAVVKAIHGQAQAGF